MMTYSEMAADLRAKRDALNDAIAALELLAGEAPSMPLGRKTPPAPASAKKARRVTDPSSVRTRAAATRLADTMLAERIGTKARAPRPTPASSGMTDRILTALKTAGEPLSPADLAKAVGVTRANLFHHHQATDPERPPHGDRRPAGTSAIASVTYTPGHRVIQPTTAKATGELPWWARAERGRMTETARKELDRMTTEKPKVAASVRGVVNEV